MAAPVSSEALVMAKEATLIHRDEIILMILGTAQSYSA